MDDALPDVPETSIDNVIVDTVDTHVEIEPSSDIAIEVSAPVEAESPVIEDENALPGENEELAPVTSDVATTEEPIVVASDVTPNTETTKEVTAEVKRTPDTRPKRKLGWRAYILGGSGGTK